ncbi:MAG: DNA polymerase III subunit gamma/tau [Acidimicrobiia bacterium]
MTAQSLYRKYRPQRFAELVGQEHVTNALRNAVRDGRVGHAYLFSGPRGTGKTTSARILARALNCTNVSADGEPCGECEYCKSVAVGNAFDVIEIDAASNNRVEEIRELIERVAYRAAGGGMKVYIVDEVHELTDRASNALLKTLEEPPDHVVFVLATTNPERVLPTIRSRTQHYEFSLLTTEQLQAHLADVLTREGVTFEPEALEVVARRGAGSARDSLSLLDQVLAGADGAITMDTVATMLGGSSFELRAEILEAIAANDPARAVLTLEALLGSGHEPRRVADELLRAARDAFVLTASGGDARVDRSHDERERLVRIGADLGVPSLGRMIESLGQAVVDMRGTEAADPRLVLEVALVRLARAEGGTPLDQLAARLDRLERAVGSGAPLAAPNPAPAPAPAPAPTANVAPASASPAAAKPAAAPVAPAESLAAAPTPPPAPAADAPRGPAGAKAALGALRKASPSAAKAPASAPSPASEPPVSAPAPAAASAPPAPPAKPLALDEVIAAWSQVLPALSIATRSAVSEAQPISVEGDVVTFGVPSALIDAAKPRFQKDAPIIREAFVDRLGRTVRFKLVPYDGFADSAPHGSELSTAAPMVPTADSPSDDVPPPVDSDVPPDDGEDEVVDLTELVDANDAPVPSALNRLQERFDATVVDEKPRS